jgi:hypothetical protein
MTTDSFPVQPERGGVSAPFARLLTRVTALRLTRVGLIAGLAVLVLVSVWLRTRAIHQYFWIDEGISVGIASHPLSQIPSLMRQDGSPPLYYFLLHFWISAFGKGVVATHVLSLIFSLLAIPIAYWAGASLFSRRTGWICAVLAAGLPYLTQYGQETRMYSLLAVLTLIASASFLHGFVRRRRRYLPVFSISLAAVLYTHNWGLFFGLMCGAAFLLVVFTSPAAERRGLWRDGVLAFGGTAVLYAPWVPTLFYQAQHTGAPWDVGPVFWSITQGLYFLVAGRGPAMTLLFGAGVGLVALMSFRGEGRERIGIAAKALLTLGIGTMLLAWVYSKVTPAWGERYLAVVAAPLILLFGLGLARARKLGLVALAFVIGFWLTQPVPSSLSTKSNVASAIAAVRPSLGTDPLVLATQPETVPVLSYYLPAVTNFGTPIGRVPDPNVADWINALERLEHSSTAKVLTPMLDSLASGQRVVLVTPIPSQYMKTPPYLALIARFSREWSRTLADDPQLRLIAQSARGAGKSGVAVIATVFERR